MSFVDSLAQSEGLSPGSFNDYLDQNPHLNRTETIAGYSQTLGNHRGFLAEAMGVTEEDLHILGVNKLQNGFNSGELTEA